MVFLSYKKIILSLFILFFVFFGFATNSYAQLSSDVIPDDLDAGSIYDTGPNADDIEVLFNPQNPGAFQDVVMQVTSDYIDLNRYAISWFVDGKRITSGIGKRKAVVTTRGYGQQSTIIILVQLPDITVKKTLTFTPQEMTLTWEAVDSYVPPFYQGKKLPGRESIIKAVAIPNFNIGSVRSFDPSTGVYLWSRNDNVVAEASGYGKDSFLLKNNKIRAAETISVEASNTSGDAEAAQTVTINMYNPKILFYERNTRTGIISPLAKTILSLVGENTTIIGEPYFFSLSDNNPNKLTFQWTMNDQPITLTDLTDQKTLILRNQKGSGTASLGLVVSNPNTAFQGALSKLLISFNFQQ